jgi:hypothetical protein
MADNLLITANVDGMHFVNQGLACLSFHKVLDNELITYQWSFPHQISSYSITATNRQAPSILYELRSYLPN